MSTKIEWCDEVWNPTSGCTKVSSGCKNCYAERIAKRFWGDRKFTDVRYHPERLDIPLHWKKPRRIFVDSISDLFHEDVPDEFIDHIFGIMDSDIGKRHTYLILTKRPTRMLEYITSCHEDRDWVYAAGASGIYFSSNDWPLPNVWLGVSIEDQKTAYERIYLLLQTPAAMRFVSVEPMLERINLRPYLFDWNSETVNWVICGCESGPDARPMSLDWARSLRDQCIEASIPFFLKQAMIDCKLVKMPELDGKVWAEYPEATCKPVNPT